MLLNPVFLYCCLWLSVMILYSFRLSNILLPWTQTSLLFLFFSMLAFLSGWIFYLLITKRLVVSPKLKIEIYRSWLFSQDVSNKIRNLTFVFITGYLIEVLYVGNLPILSLFGIGQNIIYTEFGFAGIHGLFNACLFVVCNILFFRQILRPSKRRNTLLIIFSLIPLLFVSRQFLSSLFIQYAFIYFLAFPDKPLKLLQYIKKYTKYLLAIITAVLIFGYIGDIRFSREGILYLSQPTFEYPDYLPSGLIWVYIYISSPINNLIANCDIVEPSYLPMQLIGGIIPSFARELFYSITGYIPTAWYLPDQVFNVSSIHRKFIMDFGLFITPILYFLISYITTKIMDISRFIPKYGLVLVVILHGIFLSFFADLLFHLVFISQILIYIFYLPKLKFSH